MKKRGKLEIWSEKGQKEFGIATVKCEGYRIERFFLPFSNVVVCEPEKPYRGCVVLFNVSSSKPHPGKLPLAIEAEVYEPTTVAVATESSTTEAA